MATWYPRGPWPGRADDPTPRNLPKLGPPWLEPLEGTRTGIDQPLVKAGKHPPPARAGNWPPKAEAGSQPPQGAWLTYPLRGVEPVMVTGTRGPSKRLWGK